MLTKERGVFIGLFGGDSRGVHAREPIRNEPGSVHSAAVERHGQLLQRNIYHNTVEYENMAVGQGRKRCEKSSRGIVLGWEALREVKGHDRKGGKRTAGLSSLRWFHCQVSFKQAGGRAATLEDARVPSVVLTQSCPCPSVALHQMLIGEGCDSSHLWCTQQQQKSPLRTKLFTTRYKVFNRWRG